MDRLADLADPIRARILLALESHPLTVSELQATLQLPQSTVSRHLRVLGEGAWVAARPDGPSHRYRFLRDALPQDRQRLWALVREELASTRAARGDAQRLHTVLTRRHARARRFFASEATRWDALRTELFGPRLELLALLGMLEPDWVVGDLGCGTGPLSAAVAPFVHRVVAVDESAEMLAAARARLAGFDQVEIREGELELLPVNEAELDLAVLALVLPYLPEPARVIAEAARALEAGGRLLVVDLTAHDRSELEERMGHLWPGFEESQMLEWMTAAGLVGGRVRPLPQDPEAKGPALFVATARKPTDRGHATP
jgi:ArsR family transcriptional regulator